MRRTRARWQALYTYLVLHVMDETSGRASRRARQVPAKDPDAPPVFHPYNRVWILPLNLASYSAQQVASVGGKIPKIYLCYKASTAGAADGRLQAGSEGGRDGGKEGGGETQGVSGGGDKCGEGSEGEGGGRRGADAQQGGEEQETSRTGAYRLVVFRNGDALWAFLLDAAVSVASGHLLTQLAGTPHPPLSVPSALRPWPCTSAWVALGVPRRGCRVGSRGSSRRCMQQQPAAAAGKPARLSSLCRD